jgi:hypothetical protein
VNLAFAGFLGVGFLRVVKGPGPGMGFFADSGNLGWFGGSGRSALSRVCKSETRTSLSSGNRRSFGSRLKLLLRPKAGATYSAASLRMTEFYFSIGIRDDVDA